MGRIGPGEILLLALVALLVFGASRISDIGRGLGEGIKNFKKGLKEDDDAESPPKQIKEGESEKKALTSRMASLLRRPARPRALLVTLALATSALVSFAGCGDDTASPAVAPSGGSSGSAGSASGASGSTGVAGKSGSDGKGGTASKGGSGGSEDPGGAGGSAGEGATGGTSGEAGQAGSGTAGSTAAGAAGNGSAGEGGASAGGSSAGTSGSAGKAGAPDKFPFLPEYEITGSPFPEGGTYDSSAHVFYVGSLKNGSVTRIDAATGLQTEVFKETAPGLWWTLGMDVDLVRRRLWVCAMDDRIKADPPEKSRAGRVWVFDLATNKRIVDYPLKPAKSDGTCTDVSVAANGDAYITDREQGIVYRAAIDTPPAIFATDPLLKGGLLAGLNGISVLPDQSALLAVVYEPSRLVRIDLTTKKATEVDIEGPFLDQGFLAGADGLTLFKGNAYVAFTNRFIQVVPKDAAWTKGVSTAIDDVPEGLTDVVATPHGIYFLNGQSVDFAFGAEPDKFKLKLFDGIL